MESVALDPSAPDRLSAPENLCKIGAVPAGRVAAAFQQIAETAYESDAVFALWGEAKAGIRTARVRLLRDLHSTDPETKARAAFVVATLWTEDAAVRHELAEAARRDACGPEDDWVYVLGAAFLVDADPSRENGWREELQSMLRTAPATTVFEACRCLSRHDGMTSVPLIAPLLWSADVDTRIGAAAAILRALKSLAARQRREPGGTAIRRPANARGANPSIQ